MSFCLEITETIEVSAQRLWRQGNPSGAWKKGFMQNESRQSKYSQNAMALPGELWYILFLVCAPHRGGTRLSSPCHMPVSHSFKFTLCSIGLTTNGRLFCTQKLVSTGMGSSPVLLWSSKELTSSTDAAVCSVNVGLYKHKAFNWDSGL